MAVALLIHAFLPFMFDTYGSKTLAALVWKRHERSNTGKKKPAVLPKL